jgi:hypothetical protein
MVHFISVINFYFIINKLINCSWWYITNFVVLILFIGFLSSGLTSKCMDASGGGEEHDRLLLRLQ